MKSLEVAQRELLGQLATNNITSWNLMMMIMNQVSGDRCPLSAEQSQAAPQAFSLEKIHEQMKRLEVGQRELSGQLASNNISSRNQVTSDGCPLLAEQSLAATQAP